MDRVGHYMRLYPNFEAALTVVHVHACHLYDDDLCVDHLLMPALDPHETCLPTSHPLHAFGLDACYNLSKQIRFISLQKILQPFNGLFSRTTWVRWYQIGKTNLDFTGARDSEWQWHQLGHVQV